MKNLTKKLKTVPKQISVLLIAIVMLTLSGVNSFASADNTTEYSDKVLSLRIEAIQNAFKDAGTLPVAPLKNPDKVINVTVTAYNSVPGQTDSTPCIGAQNTDICKYLELGSNTCAANFVPLGTEMHIEGLGTCVVRDRMNARYTYRVDWYMGMDIAEAKKFGVRNKTVAVYYK